MSEFCPRCTAPLEISREADRLCEVCGWFGDQQEALPAPSNTGEFNPVLAVAQTLELYRDVCRQELIAEQIYDAGDIIEAELQKIHVIRRQATAAAIDLFVTLRGRVRQQLKRINGFVPWPRDWTDYHYNATNEPCDCLLGPCSCGAWHQENEDWVRAILLKHNAEIIDGDQS